MKTAFILILFLFAGPVAYSQACINVSTSCNGTSNYNYCYNCTSDDCGPYELSKGIYRIPFKDGTVVEITGDHFSHCPRGRIDMVGDDDHIVAAADGWIREIVDTNTVQCTCSGTTFCENNYIWMEHSNGEWTKYTHMQTNSVPSSLIVGGWVLKGTVLGLQGDVGCAGGVHLHFEVAQPIDTNTLVYEPIGGYIVKTWARNVIPVICGISGNVFKDGETYSAAGCPSGCGEVLPPVSLSYSAGGYQVVLNHDEIENSNDLTFGSWSSGLFQAGNEITLTDGFHAATNSDFSARIGDCDEFSPKNSQSILQEAHLTPEEKVKVYPNPTSGITTVEFVLTEESWVTLQLNDLTGRIVSHICEKRLLEKGLHRFMLQAEDFADGSYLCVATIGGKKLVSKVVIEH